MLWLLLLNETDQNHVQPWKLIEQTGMFLSNPSRGGGPWQGWQTQAVSEHAWFDKCLQHVFWPEWVA